MHQKIKNALKEILPPHFFARKFWSQNAEDILISRLLQNCPRKFYVDVGCNHPFHDNNTLLFYKKGWKGINIDANPKIQKLNQRFRKKDINVCFGVSKAESTLTYYKFTPDTNNTFDQESAERQKNRGITFNGSDEIQTLPLVKILEKNIPKNQKISFMSVDIEGLDEEALQSNDWGKFRPKVLIVEINDLYINKARENSMVRLLETLNYQPYLKTINNWIFVDMNEFIKEEHSDVWWKDQLK